MNHETELEITRELVSGFVPGRVQLNHYESGFAFFCEVREVELTGLFVSELKAKLAFTGCRRLEEGKGDRSLIPMWVKGGAVVEYTAILKEGLYTAHNLGPSPDKPGSGDRICFEFPEKREVIIFFPDTDIREHQEECYPPAS